MGYTQTDLDRINDAIATGELSISYKGRTTTFRSIDDLIKAKREIESSLASSSGRMYPRRQVASFSD